MTSAPPQKTLIVVPCFNEGENVARVVTELKQHCAGCTVLVVDDGSRDDTTEVASKMTNVVRLPVNLGIGGAVQTGIKYARQFDYDCCFQVDGDGQHPAGELNKFFEEQRASGANLIVGSRFLNGDGFQSTGMRRFGISILRGLVRWLTRIPVTDPTSGFRMLDRKAIELFSRDYPLDYPEPVSLVIASESGLAVKEIPTVMREREHGISSIAPLAYMVRVCCYLIFVRLRRYL